MAVTEELVDLVDADDRVVEVVTRAEMRARGASARHRACYVAVRTSSGDLVVHRRADWKDAYPGWWDVCFGGVLGAGEEWGAAAHRELLEEAGVDAQPELVAVTSWSSPQAVVNARVFVVTHDGPFRFDDGEVVEMATVPLDGLDAWLECHDVCPDSVDLVVPLVKSRS